MTSIPVFLINLDRRPDRLSEMRRRLAAVTFERITAVDGRSLTDEDVDRFVSPRRQYEMSRCEVGCFLSHRRAWQTIVDRDLPIACILEDDAQLSPDFPDFVRTSDWLPVPFDLIKIETRLRQTWISRTGTPARDRILAELRSFHFGAAAYLMSSVGASRLLESTVRPDRAVDDCLFQLSARRSSPLRVLQLSPALCAQDSVLSGCNTDSDLASERSALRAPTQSMFWREIGRKIRKVGQRSRVLARSRAAETCVIPYS